jgi:chromate transporter
VRFGSLPQIAGVLYGVKPVVIAVIAQAIFRLGGTALKSAWLILLCVAATVAAALGVNGLLVFAVVGLVTALAFQIRYKKPVGRTAALLAGSGGMAGAAAASFSLKALFLVFLKIGAILFGGGYVLVAFLRSNLVQGLGWISERQLLDAIAVGQVTPGPISTAATFLGYILAGFPGAAVATVAIFLPAFALVAITGPFVPQLRRWPLAGAVLDGINVAALAIIVVVAWQLGRSAIVDGVTLAIALVSGFLLIRYRMNSAWLVLAGAVAGMAFMLIRI